MIQVSALCEMYFTHENHMEILEGQRDPTDVGGSFRMCGSLCRVYIWENLGAK
jgi:hypothetical protein